MLLGNVETEIIVVSADTPGTGITKLYLDKKKPEFFFVVLNNNNLRITWKRGSHIWGNPYKKVIVKVISSDKQYTWQSENNLNSNKPFQKVFFLKFLKINKINIF